MWWVVCLFLSVVTVQGDDRLGLVVDDAVCASLSSPSDEYWDAVTSCSPCVKKGCGYCLSTLQCQGGDERGPRPDAMPCPSWVWADDAECPVIPECGTLNSCGDCAMHEMCAWCANDQKCMTIEVRSRDFVFPHFFKILSLAIQGNFLQRLPRRSLRCSLSSFTHPRLVLLTQFYYILPSQ